MGLLQEKLKATWPDWEISEKIGEGAFGEVFKATRHDLAGTTYAAIKAICIPGDDEELEELKAEGLTLDQSYAYFRQVVKDYTHEIQVMDSVKGYTNIVSIDDYKIVESQDPMRWYIFIRMELLTPLMKKAAVDGMTEGEIIRAGIDLCTALEVCRKKNIVHRDIKPQNIFVNSEGDYKLGDFGVARSLERVTGNLSRKGAPNYMAPELYKASLKEIDIDDAAKVDIYSLGLALYWMANRSRLPFLPQDKQIATPEDRENAFIRRISGEELPAPALGSPELRRIILKACAYQPEDRYASAGEMKKDLIALRDRAQEPRTTEETAPAGKKPAEPAEPLPAKAGKPRSKRWLIPAAAALLIILAVLARFAIRPPAPPEPAGGTEAATEARTEEPTAAPTEEPTEEPTAAPTEEPTEEPTAAPTEEPTEEPTAEPSPTLSPSPSPTPSPSPSPRPVPSLTARFSGTTAKLHAFSAGGSAERITLYAGPGSDYGKSRTISAGGQKKVTAYFAENGWVYTCIVHQEGSLYAYVPRSWFEYLGDVPEITVPYSMSGTTVRDAEPRWGPDDGFEAEKDCAAAEGTAVKAFFSDGDYIYCEYACESGTVRMWLPSSAVRITD